MSALATESAIELRAIHHSELVPSPHNKRRWMPDDSKDADIVDLARSIERHGRNFQNVIVRKHPRENGKFEIVAGERRWRAVRLSDKQGGDQSVAVVMCEVRELDDAQAFEITMDENKKRKNLSPLEEADTLNAYLSAHGDWTIDQAAAQMGVSRQVAARRMQLINLSEKWKHTLDAREHAVCHWSAAHLERVAALSQNVQDELLSNIMPEEAGMTLKELKAELARLCHTLADAPWKLDDDTLVKKVPACISCPKRSSCQPDLFDEDDFETGGKKKVKAGDQCLDHLCFARKMGAWMVRREAELRTQHPNLLLLKTGYGSSFPHQEKLLKKAQSRYEFIDAKASDKGAIPALVLGEQATGKLIYVLSTYGGSTSSSKSKSDKSKSKSGKKDTPAAVPMKERRTALAKSRAKLVISYLLDEVENCIKKDLFPCGGDSDQFAFVLAFGTSHMNGRSAFGYTAGDKCWQQAQAFRKSNPGVLTGSLTKSALENLVARFHQMLGNSSSEFEKEARACCEYFGWDFDAYWQKACEERPEPKSWAKLNADGTPKEAAPAKGDTKAKKSTGGKCRVCGCTEATPCTLRDGSACAWIEKSQTLCNNPACVKQASKDTKAKAKKRRAA